MNVSQRSRKNKPGGKGIGAGIGQATACCLFVSVFCPMIAWRMRIPMASLHPKQTNKQTNDVLLFPSHFLDKETEDQVKFPLNIGCNYNVAQTICPYPGLHP